MAVATAVPMAPMAQAVAVPMAPMPVAAQMTPASNNFTKGQGYTPSQPSGKWAIELCECCSAGGMCCAACCCSFITGPQLFQKYTGQEGSCKKWGGIMIVLYIVYQMAGQVSQRVPFIVPGEVDGIAIDPLGLALSLGQWLAWLLLCSVGTYVLMTVRKIIRQKDNIPAASCGDSEDCCCAFWCPCCTTIQMFVQGEIRCENGYKLCTEEGIETLGGPAV